MNLSAATSRDDSMKRLTIDELVTQALVDMGDLPEGFTDRLRAVISQPGDRPSAIRRLVEECSDE